MSVPADGIAFVIQGSGTSALGPDGCGMGFVYGYLRSGPSACILEQLAVAFKTYDDGDNFNNGNSVLINSQRD